jgi:serine/threonine protein kinase
MQADEPADQHLPPPGTLFAGRYRIERLLGVGGMGSVLLARHEVIGQHVALKLLHPEAAHSPAAVERFVREARAASKIEGQHVVKIYDVGTEAGRPYLCMEYLRGQDLGQLFDASGPMPSYEVCTALLDAIVALAQAHSAGIVHRDLKPSNLFFAEQPAGKPVLKVLDFGIAKMDDGPSNMHATSTGMIMGTPSYMAPEQMRSSKMVDARADIWALGVIAYELLTGRLPFQGDSLGDILFAVVEKPPPLPHQLRPELDPELSAVVMKCLQRDPAKRFATVTELSDALEPFATASRYGTSAALRLSISGERASAQELDLLSSARTEQVMPSPAANPKTVSEWVTESHARPRRNTRVLVGIAAAVVVLGLGLGAGRTLLSSHAGDAGGAPSAVAAAGSIPLVAAPEPTTSVVAAPPTPLAPATATNPASDATHDAGAVVAVAPAAASSKLPPSRPGVGAHKPPPPAGSPPAKPSDGSGMTNSKDWDGVPAANGGK